VIEGKFVNRAFLDAVRKGEDAIKARIENASMRPSPPWLTLTMRRGSWLESMAAKPAINRQMPQQRRGVPKGSTKTKHVQAAGHIKGRMARFPHGSPAIYFERSSLLEPRQKALRVCRSTPLSELGGL
jgi:hypothetical protein